MRQAEALKKNKAELTHEMIIQKPIRKGKRQSLSEIVKLSKSEG